MNPLFTEQFTIIFLTLVTALTYLIKQLSKEMTDYLKTKLELKQKLAETTTNIEIENLKKNAERENLKEDKLLELQLNRNILHEGIKLINILKETREIFNARNVYISIFHNNVAKGFKNYSIRFEEARTMEHSISENHQSINLSPLYTELVKFEKQNYIIDTKQSQSLTIIKQKTKERSLVKKIYFPILDEMNNTKYPNTTVFITKNDIEYVLIGIFVVCIDDKSLYIDDDEALVKLTEEKLIQIMKLYDGNNLIFS